MKERKMLNKAMILPYMAYYRLKWGIEEFWEDDNALSGIVVAVVLSLIAVVVAIVFKDKIKEFVETTWEKTTEKVDGI